MSRRIDPAVLYSLLSLALFPVLAHAGKKPDPCPAGRYVVVTPEGAPFVAVEYGETVALDAVCDPIAPVKLSTTRKGATKVKTKWDTCIGFSGKVRLGAKITDDCTMLSGTLDGTLIHATARVRDVVGSAARAGVTTAVN